MSPHRVRLGSVNSIKIALFMFVKKSGSQRSTRYAMSVLLSAVLAACGGGGGGSSEPVAETPAPSPAPSPSPSPSPAPAPNLAPVASLAYAPSAPNLLRVGGAVTLSATSTDPDSQSLTHTWTLVSRPAGSSAVLGVASGASTTFTPDVVGNYVVSITSNDGATSSTAVTTLEVVNRVPTVSLGYDGTAPAPITAGTTLVRLRATGSDADGQALTYTWTLVSRPSTDTSTTLGSTTGATTSFTPRSAGTYQVRVSTSDGMASVDSALFSITATAPAAPPPPPPPPVNTAPTAALSRTVPGPTGTAVIGSPVTFSATSTDDGLPTASTLTHLWTLTRPTGSTVPTSGSGSAFSFTPDRFGTYSVSLVSSDGSLSSTNAATASVVVSNRPPTAAVALAPTQSATISVGETVALISTGTDADGQPLTHSWSLTRPAGDTTTALATSAPIAPVAPATTTTNSFRPTVAGTYAVGLNVTDGLDTVAATALTVTVAAQPGEVACTPPATATSTVYRFQQPTAVAPALPSVSVGDTSSTSSPAGTRGNRVCFHQTVLRDVRGLDQIVAQGGYFYFEATRSGPAHVGVAAASYAPVVGSLGNLTWPTDTTNASFVLSPCNPAVNANAPGCLMQDYDAGSTPRTAGFAVDYRGNYPIVYVIGQPTDRADLPAGCRNGASLLPVCVIASAALNTSGPVNIYAYGQTAPGTGGVMGSVSINGGEVAGYSIGANVARDALRRYRYEAGRGFNTPRWPRTHDSAVMPALASITRGSPINTVIRIGDSSPGTLFRTALTVSATGGTVTWRNSEGTPLGTGTTLSLPTPATAGALPSGWTVGDNRIEAVHEVVTSGVLRMSAAVSYLVRYAPAAPASGPDTTDEDWDGDGVSYQAERTAGTDPANPDTNNDGIADGVTATAVAGFAANTTLIHTTGVASPGAVISDDGWGLALTSLINPRCIAYAAAGSYASLSRETCNKRGVLASQGVVPGSFRYYEVRKRAPNVSLAQAPNMGAGVMVSGAVNPGAPPERQWGMDPYGYVKSPPADPETPYSASFNFARDTYLRLVGNGSTLTNERGAESEYVGILVDYRGSVPILRFVFNEVVAGPPSTLAPS